MTAKTNVWPVVSDHIGTLVSYESDQTSRVSARDIAVQYVLPVLTGAACALATESLISIGNILAGAAIMTAFSFGLAIFAFQARTSITGVKGSRRLRLLDEFFANVLYSVLVGLAWSLLLMVLAVVDVSGAWSRVANGLVTAVGLHYLVVMLMCIKRLRAVYRDLTR